MKDTKQISHKTFSLLRGSFIIQEIVKSQVLDTLKYLSSF